MKKISAKQQRILDYISEFSLEHGYPPSVREICAEMELRSPSTVHAHLKKLQEAGYLEPTEHKSRALAPVSGPSMVPRVPILGRAESFASKNSVAASAIDGIAQGLGYTIILVVMCVVREFLGGGTFGAGVISAKGIQILPSGIPALGMILPVGGFLTLAVVIAAMQYFLNRPKKDETSEEVSK